MPSSLVVLSHGYMTGTGKNFTDQLSEISHLISPFLPALCTFFQSQSPQLAALLHRKTHAADITSVSSFRSLPSGSINT